MSATREFTKPTCACADWTSACLMRITAMAASSFFDDDKETPEVLTSVYHYPKQKKMIQFEVRHCVHEHGTRVGVGNIFYGSDGTC